MVMVTVSPLLLVEKEVDVMKGGMKSVEDVRVTLPGVVLVKHN